MLCFRGRWRACRFRRVTGQNFLISLMLMRSQLELNSLWIAFNSIKPNHIVCLQFLESHFLLFTLWNFVKLYSWIKHSPRCLQRLRWFPSIIYLLLMKWKSSTWWDWSIVHEGDIFGFLEAFVLQFRQLKSCFKSTFGSG